MSMRPNTDLLPGEKNRDYIERQFAYLFENKLISPFEKKKLVEEESKDYRLTNFGFGRPLFVEHPQNCLDSNKYRRYYARPIHEKYHLCKEWYFDPEHPSYNLDKLQRWLGRMMQSSTANE